MVKNVKTNEKNDAICLRASAFGSERFITHEFRKFGDERIYCQQCGLIIDKFGQEYTRYTYEEQEAV